jgi:hypothetical protein
VAALDPNKQVKPDEIIDDPESFENLGTLPPGVTKTKDYYAIRKQLADGRTSIEWYKRGGQLKPGEEPHDPIIARTSGYTKDVGDQYAKDTTAAGKNVTRKYLGTDPKTGLPAVVTEYDSGEPDYDSTAAAATGSKPTIGRVEGTPLPGGGFDNTAPIWVERDANQQQIGPAKPLTAEQRKQWESDRAGIPSGPRPASERQPLPGKPGVYVVKTVDPQTNTTDTHYENDAGQVIPEPAPDPKVISAPANQKWIAREDPVTHKTTYEFNQAYVPPSQIITDPNTGRLIQVTQDPLTDEPIKRDVTDKTTIRPTDIPVLQTKYGQISSSLGALAQDLNGRVARGEMTAVERDAAFKAAHEQATVAVNELNSILENSRSVWTNQIKERSDTFTEAANRRSYASSIMNNAVTTGSGIAESAGPGHGRAIAEGVMTLMDMGQRYAAGMGGLPSMERTPLPPALQQAAGVGLPGFPMPGAPQGSPEGAVSGSVSGQPPPGGLPAGGPPSGGPSGAAIGPVTGGVTATTAAAMDPTGPNIGAATDATMAGSGAAFGALGMPRGGLAPAFRPPPPVPGQAPVVPPLGIAPAQGGPQPQPMPFTGQDPRITPLSGLGASMGMGAGGSPIGVPQAADGGGLFDPAQEAQGMLAASMTGGYGGQGVADPEWERAVRAAMGLYGGG